MHMFKILGLTARQPFKEFNQVISE
jgi:hypothetical protein